jgi:D-3-phosphoglycerate dehydrogenase
MPHKIAVSQADMPDAIIEAGVFERAPLDVDLVTGAAENEAELIELARGADGLAVQYAEVTAAVLEELPNLSVVSRYGIGVDNIDIDAASEHGVAVTHVPSYCEEEVASHALGLLLSVARNTAQYDRQVRSGTWDWKQGQSIEALTGQTVGFVAFGKIPQTFAKLAEGFEFEYLTYDPYIQAEDLAGFPVTKVEWETLLETSDIVSIHTPLVEETRHMFDTEAFEMMKSSAILINTARGPIVDESALNTALQDNAIGGAGLDVMETEPTHDSPLFEREETVITPHVAWYSESSLAKLRRKTAENITRYLQDESPHGFANEASIQE